MKWNTIWYTFLICLRVYEKRNRKRRNIIFYKYIFHILFVFFKNTNKISISLKEYLFLLFEKTIIRKEWNKIGILLDPQEIESIEYLMKTLFIIFISLL